MRFSGYFRAKNEHPTSHPVFSMEIFIQSMVRARIMSQNISKQYFRKKKNNFRKKKITFNKKNEDDTFKKKGRYFQEDKKLLSLKNDEKKYCPRKGFINFLSY